MTSGNDETRTRIGIFASSDDTARQQAEETLLKAGALQSAIFNSANFSSIATDASHAERSVTPPLFVLMKMR